MTFEEAIDIVMNHKEEDGLYRLPDGLGDATYIIRQLEKSNAPIAHENGILKAEKIKLENELARLSQHDEVTE